MRRVGLSARRLAAWSALTGVEATRGGHGRPRQERALSGAPERDAHAPVPARRARGPLQVDTSTDAPRPGPPAASATATSSGPARCRTPKRPTVRSPGTRARSGRGRPPPSSPPSSTACPTSLPIPVAAAAGPPRIVGIPTEWGRHLWGRRDPRDAPGGKVCDNFPHFAPPRIFLGNTRVSKVKYGDTPVTSP